MKIDQSLFLDLAKLVRQAGQAALEIYEEEDFGVQIKSDNSPVTKADLKVNQILTDGLKELTPSIPVVSEEANLSYEERKNFGRFWIIDPIDGTKEFIKRSGEFTINLGLVEKLDRPREGAQIKPTFGIIYIPVSDELFIGGQEIGPINLNLFHQTKVVADWSGGSRFSDAEKFCTRAYLIRGSLEELNTTKDEPIKAVPIVTRVMGKEDKLILTCSKDHNRPSDFDFIHNLSKDFYCKLVPCGSTIKICRIAQGKADIYIRTSGINDWDLAAGHAIVEAAGGKITTLDGQELIYNTEKQRLDPFIVFGQINAEIGGAAYALSQIDWTKWVT